MERDDELRNIMQQKTPKSEVNRTRLTVDGNRITINGDISINK